MSSYSASRVLEPSASAVSFESDILDIYPSEDIPESAEFSIHCIGETAIEISEGLDTLTLSAVANDQLMNRRSLQSFLL